MQLAFLKLKDSDRRLYFDQAAQPRGLNPVIVEKDFWVCWTLAVLFGSALRDHLVFKGGTSLSKVFGAIHRFSEDIDLSLSPKHLGIDDVEDARTLSKTKASHWMDAAQQAGARTVNEVVRPELEAAIGDVLGESEEPWLMYEFDETTRTPVILFRYPSNQVPGFEYLKRSVKLEFGSLTDQQPTDRHPVRPWVAEDFLGAFADWQCSVVCLDLRRSFWEKATILHVEHHRPAGKPSPDRYSRHHADTAALSKHREVARALDDPELRDRVVAWKSRFFGSGWARYDLAKPGTFRLAPQAAQEAGRRADYRAMQDMYLTEPEDFDEILETLRGLEARINGA